MTMKTNDIIALIIIAVVFAKLGGILSIVQVHQYYDGSSPYITCDSEYVDVRTTPDGGYERVRILIPSCQKFEPLNGDQTWWGYCNSITEGFKIGQAGYVTMYRGVDMANCPDVSTMYDANSNPERQQYYPKITPTTTTTQPPTTTTLPPLIPPSLNFIDKLFADLFTFFSRLFGLR